MGLIQFCTSPACASNFERQKFGRCPETGVEGDDRPRRRHCVLNDLSIQHSGHGRARHPFQQQLQVRPSAIRPHSQGKWDFRGLEQRVVLSLQVSGRGVEGLRAEHARGSREVLLHRPRLRGLLGPFRWVATHVASSQCPYRIPCSTSQWCACAPISGKRHEGAQSAACLAAFLLLFPPPSPPFLYLSDSILPLFAMNVQFLHSACSHGKRKGPRLTSETSRVPSRQECTTPLRPIREWERLQRSAR